MEIITVIYIVFFSVIMFALMFAVLWVSGRDIYLAFKRRFLPRGCDVYIANQTRIISHYFLVPKEGVFRIKKLPYVTNPEKTMNLTEEERKSVLDALLKRKVRLEGRIKEFEGKVKLLNDQLKSTKDEKQKFFIKSQIEHHNSILKEFKAKLKVKQENYFKDKRPAFFYIENDPIPKDFYEYMSSLDSKMVDNLVSRSISAPPSGAKTDQDIKNMKLFLIGAAIAAGVAAFMAVQNNAMITQICTSVGAACGG